MASFNLLQQYCEQSWDHMPFFSSLYINYTDQGYYSAAWEQGQIMTLPPLN